MATNDSHYVSQDQSAAHDALLCVQTNALIDDETRFRFVKKFGNIKKNIKSAVIKYKNSIKQKKFPSKKNSY